MTTRLKTKKPMSRGTKPLRPKKPMARGTKPMARGTKPLRSRRARPARRGKQVSRQHELLPPRADLVVELDSLVSLIVRVIYPVCVTCRRAARLTNSHIFRRGCVEIRFDHHRGGNCVTQCDKCNQLHSLRPQILYGWFIREYGLSRFEELRQKWRQRKHIPDHVLASKLETCKKVVAGMPAELIAQAKERALKL